MRKCAALAVAAVLIVAACGNDGDEPQAGSSTGAVSTTASAPVAASSAAPGSEAPATSTSGSTPPDSAAGRFTGDDHFCAPAAGQPAEVNEATGPGIGTDSIAISHVRMKLEDLVDIGFAYDNGDTADQVDTFVRIVNEECGGINGRLLDLQTVDLPTPGVSADPELDAQAACTEIVQDHHAVAAFSFTGVGNPLARCLSGANDVVYITTFDLSNSDFEQADGRLFSVNHAPSAILTSMVRHFADQLAGKTIGVVYGDADPDPQVVNEGAIDALDAAGLEPARMDVLGCGQGPPCTGVIESVQGMKADKVDALFLLVDPVSLPAYIGEMVTQGFKAGDVQFYNSSFQAQDSELVTSKLVEFAGETAGQLYDGAHIMSGSRNGEHRLDGYEPSAFMAMCNREYLGHSTVVTQPYDLLDDDDNRRADSVTSHCSGVRLLARAIEAAGPNPTRESIAAALADLGPVDIAGGGPASFVPGKPTAPDAVVELTFHFPCPVPTSNSAGTCLLPETGFLPVPDQ